MDGVAKSLQGSRDAPGTAPMKTQLEKVYAALKEGGTTSIEISAMTGLPMEHCSSYLNELKHMGVAEIVHRNWVTFTGPGRAHLWCLKKGSPWKQHPK